MIISNVAVDDQFERPGAIAKMSALPDVELDEAAGIFKRLTRYLRLRLRLRNNVDASLDQPQASHPAARLIAVVSAWPLAEDCNSLTQRNEVSTASRRNHLLCFVNRMK
ncbi:MAG: hypothetical protein ACJAR2_002061, partial [Ilumatobacter sp.]